MSLEMAQKVIVPQKKNYVPQFLKQRDINSYYRPFFRNRVLLVSPVLCVLLCVLKGLSIIRWEGRGVINTEQQYSLSLSGILLRLVCLFACVCNRGWAIFNMFI
jgi:hypothetical protein